MRFCSIAIYPVSKHAKKNHKLRLKKKDTTFEFQTQQFKIISNRQEGESGTLSDTSVQTPTISSTESSKRSLLDSFFAIWSLNFLVSCITQSVRIEYEGKKKLNELTASANSGIGSGNLYSAALHTNPLRGSEEREKFVDLALKRRLRNWVDLVAHELTAGEERLKIVGRA